MEDITGRKFWNTHVNWAEIFRKLVSLMSIWSLQCNGDYKLSSKLVYEIEDSKSKLLSHLKLLLWAQHHRSDKMKIATKVTRQVKNGKYNDVDDWGKVVQRVSEVISNIWCFYFRFPTRTVCPGVFDEMHFLWNATECSKLTFNAC